MCLAVPQQGGCSEQLLISCPYRDCARSWQRSVGCQESLQERLSYVVRFDDRGASRKAAAGLTMFSVVFEKPEGARKAVRNAARRTCSRRNQVLLSDVRCALFRHSHAGFKERSRRRQMCRVLANYGSLEINRDPCLHAHSPARCLKKCASVVVDGVTIGSVKPSANIEIANVAG